MFFTTKNFLRKQHFEYLRFYSKGIVNSALLESEGQWVRSTELLSDEVSNLEFQLGRILTAIVQDIKLKLVSRLGFEIQPHSVRFQITNENYVIHPHQDGPVLGNQLDNSFSSIVYLNDYWSADMGGFFSLGENQVIPEPNTLVFYSRDLWHSVSSAQSRWPEPRSIFLISWGKSKGK